ncbi:MAG TPA: hypothetical protein VER03_04930 [Bryobacteraceae bacterium]|nr:hypothetical protein [Bryobacteraceae bacterium]
MDRIRACLLAGVLLTAACTTHRAAVSTPAPVSNTEYIDLEPGWRAVTPLGKSGDFRLRYRELAVEGNTLTLEVDEFQGYEVSHYSVEGQGRRIRLRFTDAEAFREGSAKREARPVVPLFRIPPSTRFLRLVYLTRVSAADHNMAVIASRTPEELDALTRAARTNDKTCGIDARCSWIPTGIAVRPERKLAGSDQWTPVR